MVAVRSAALVLSSARSPQNPERQCILKADQNNCQNNSISIQNAAVKQNAKTAAFHTFEAYPQGNSNPRRLREREVS